MKPTARPARVPRVPAFAHRPMARTEAVDIVADYGLLTGLVIGLEATADGKSYNAVVPMELVDEFNKAHREYDRRCRRATEGR